tara:strand:- start:551 stop:769 length:219 start_codon:yes stop_codon:yes gene_type:complete
MIGDLFNDLIEKFIQEINKDENISKIEKSLVDPLIKYTFTKLYPYIMTVSIVFLLTFLLALLILLLQLKQFR